MSNQLLRGCPACGTKGSNQSIQTDRDDTWVSCNDCGLRMSKRAWELPRPLEMLYDKIIMEKENQIKELIKAL